MATATIELRQSLGELDAEDQEFADEACLRRYLRGYGGNIKKASTYLKATLSWRKQFRPDVRLTNDLERIILQEKFYLAGVASDDVPVMVTRKRTQRLLPQEEAPYLRYVVYTLEKAIRVMKEDVEQWVWVLDLKGYTSGNSPRLTMTRQVVKVLADHYPERLKRVYIVDAPTVFYVLYKVVYPLLDKPTQQKIAFVYSANYDESGHLLPGKTDHSNFGMYYKLYAAAHSPEAYLTKLKKEEEEKQAN